MVQIYESTICVFDSKENITENYQNLN